MADNKLITINDSSSLAFNELFNRLGSLDLTPILIYLIDNVNSTALPHLAEQFHILGNEGWLFTSSEKEKRELIKNAIKIHKYKGTKYALKKVLEVLRLNGDIAEWFDYGGKPYHFKVILNFTNKSFDSASEAQLLNLIEETKNVRSVLEKLQINLVSKSTQMIRSACVTSEEIVVRVK